MKLKLELCLALVVISSCHSSDDYQLTPERIEDIIELDITSTSVLANGADVVEVKAFLSQKADDKRSTIVFKTTSGTFVGGMGDSVSVQAKDTTDANGKSNKVAVAKLKSGLNIGRAIVTARVGSVIANGEKKIDFIKAFPTQVTVDKDTFAVKAFFAGEATVNAKISRETGSPSIGNVVDFYARDMKGTEIKSIYFRAIDKTSDSNGIASVVIGARDDTYLGDFKIYVSAKRSDNPNDSTYGETIITVLK